MEQLWYLRIDEWIRKMWYMCTMEYSLAIRNKILSVAAIWMELEERDETGEAQKDKY